jgi:hypothetical protein
MTHMTPDEIRAEIEAIEDELDQGNEEWSKTGNGPSWAYLEMLGKELYCLRQDLAAAQSA